MELLERKERRRERERKGRRRYETDKCVDCVEKKDTMINAVEYNGENTSVGNC